MKTKIDSNHSIFTLIELLVVIAIIAILAAMLLPTLNMARKQAKQIVCLSNVKQLFLGVGMYIQDYNEYLPPKIERGGWDDMSWTYRIRVYVPGNLKLYQFRLPKDKIYKCPSDTRINSFRYGYHSSYGMLESILQTKITKYKSPSNLLAMGDYGPSRGSLTNNFKGYPAKLRFTSSPEATTTSSRHYPSYTAGLLDGHNKIIPYSQVSWQAYYRTPKEFPFTGL